MKSGSDSFRVTLYAFLGNLGVAILKTIVALITNSASMLAEAIHSFADTMNQILIFVGLRRSRKKADISHPFGHGKELFFWSFIVGSSIFLLGSIFAFYEGFHKLFADTQPVTHFGYAYLVLFASILIEGFCRLKAVKALKLKNNTVGSFFTNLIHTKRASLLTVAMEDTAALLSLFFTIIFTTITWITGNGVFDAIGSLMIGVLLGFVAFFTMNESRKLLIGEGLSVIELRHIKHDILDVDGVEKIGNFFSMFLGEDSILVAVDINFEDGIKNEKLESIIKDIEAKIKEHLKVHTVHIFVESKDLTVGITSTNKK